MNDLKRGKHSINTGEFTAKGRLIRRGSRNPIEPQQRISFVNSRKKTPCSSTKRTFWKEGSITNSTGCVSNDPSSNRTTIITREIIIIKKKRGIFNSSIKAITNGSSSRRCKRKELRRSNSIGESRRNNSGINTNSVTTSTSYIAGDKA